MYLALGVVTYLVVLLAIALSLRAAGRVAASLLGVPGFRWFAARPADAAWWRRALVRMSSALGPFILSALLMWIALLVEGTPQASDGVSVLEGAARAAGMHDGDRIVAIAGAPVKRFEDIRGLVATHSGPLPIEVERDGKRLELTVTPRAGRIGVAPQWLRVRPGVGAAFARAIHTPFDVVYATGKSFAAMLGSTERAQFSGVVGIVRASSTAGEERGFLTYWAMLAAYFWPIAAAVHVFDVGSSWLFQRTHPANGRDPALLGQARLLQALVLALSGYGIVLLGLALTTLGVQAFGTALLLLMLPAVCALLPLCWIAGRQKWETLPLTLFLGASIIVPCFVPVIALLLIRDLRADLARQGFRVGLVNAWPGT